jgi:hypothetical protein
MEAAARDLDLKRYSGSRPLPTAFHGIASEQERESQKLNIALAEPARAELVKLHFFAGLPLEDAGRILGS